MRRYCVIPVTKLTPELIGAGVHGSSKDYRKSIGGKNIIYATDLDKLDLGAFEIYSAVNMRKLICQDDALNWQKIMPFDSKLDANPLPKPIGFAAAIGKLSPLDPPVPKNTPWWLLAAGLAAAAGAGYWLHYLFVS